MKLHRIITRTENDLNCSATNRDSIDLSCVPPLGSIGILQALQEEREIGISIRSQHGGDIYCGNEVNNPARESTSARSALDSINWVDKPHLTPAKVIFFGSARLWRLSLSIASLAMSFVNQNNRGLGLLGRAGIMKNPKNPQTTVIMALITNSHLKMPSAILLHEGK